MSIYLLIYTRERLTIPKNTTLITSYLYCVYIILCEMQNIQNNKGLSILSVHFNNLCETFSIKDIVKVKFICSLTIGFVTTQLKRRGKIHTATNVLRRQYNHRRCQCHRISGYMTRIHDQIEQGTPTKKTVLPL